MRVALDTNRLTDLFRGDTELSKWLEFCDEIWIPLFVLGEIKAGFEGGSRRSKNEVSLRAFLSKATVDVLLPTTETAEFYSRVFVHLKLAGTPIPDNDLWIACQALENGLLLVTRDSHFQRVPELMLAHDGLRLT